MRSFRTQAARTRSLIAGVLCALAAAAGFSGCASEPHVPQKTEKSIATIIRIRPTEVNFVSTKLLVDVLINNPYTTTLTLKNVDHDIRFEGKKVFSIIVDSGEIIAPSETKTITLPLAISYLELLTAMPNVKQGTIIPYQADLRLNFRSPEVPGFVVPLTVQDKVPVPARLDAELIELKWKVLTLESATGTARVQFTNTNAFDVRLKMLSFALWLSGGMVNRTNLPLDVPLAIGAKSVVEIPIKFSPKGMGLSSIHMLQGKKCPSIVEGGLSLDSRYGVVELPYSHEAAAPMTPP